MPCRTASTELDEQAIGWCSSMPRTKATGRAYLTSCGTNPAARRRAARSSGLLPRFLRASPRPSPSGRPVRRTHRDPPAVGAGQTRARGALGGLIVAAPGAFTSSRPIAEQALATVCGRLAGASRQCRRQGAAPGGACGHPRRLLRWFKTRNPDLAGREAAELAERFYSLAPTPKKRTRRRRTRQRHGLLRNGCSSASTLPTWRNGIWFFGRHADRVMGSDRLRHTPPATGHLTGKRGKGRRCLHALFEPECPRYTVIVVSTFVATPQDGIGSAFELPGQGKAVG